MKYAAPESTGALRSKLLREHKELAEWIRKEIAAKTKKAHSTFSRLLDRQKCSISEVGAQARKEIEALANRQARRAARLGKELDRLNERFKDIGQEAFQAQLKACRVKLAKSLRHSSQQLGLIKKEQEQILAHELGRVVKKSGRAIDQNTEHLGNSE